MASVLAKNISSKAYEVAQNILNGNDEDLPQKFSLLFDIVCDDNARLDSQDSSENGLIRAMEEQSNEYMTFHVQKNYIASDKVQKEYDRYRTADERVDWVGSADTTSEISWEEGLLHQWEPLIRKCKSQRIAIIQGWSGRVNVNGKRSPDLHCRWIVYIADVVRRIGVYYVFELNDSRMGGFSSMYTLSFFSSLHY